MILGVSITACANPFKSSEPQLNTIQDICELATISFECNDVIKATKEAGEGWSHALEKDREYWVEYTGIVEMGIDGDATEIKVKNDKVYIDLPEAKVLNVHIKSDSINEDSIYVSNDSFINSNKITADDQTEIINKAQKQLEKAFEKDEDVKASTERPLTPDRMEKAGIPRIPQA